MVGDTEREKLTDSAGKIRGLVVDFGGDDGVSTSTSTFTFYYDASGVLRFAFVQENDVFGHMTEFRTYFDAKGARIWDVNRSVHATDPSDPRTTPDITTGPYVLPDAPIAPFTR